MKFLKDDQVKAQNESDCFHYCMDIAQKHMSAGEYDKAVMYTENASRSLRELERMSETKRNMDEWVRIKQIEAQQHTAQMKADELVAASRLGPRFYE